jgi:DNA modification methylase
MIKDIPDTIIKENYALYRGDSIEKLKQFPPNSIGLSGYSPPFYDVYTYSGSPNDLANCANYDEFLKHYEFLVKEMHRVMKPGRMSCVHCADIVKPGDGGLMDMPGDFIRLHEKNGFKYWARYNIWNEPLTIRLKKMLNSLKHQTLCQDSALTRCALADYLLVFRKIGENKEPITKPVGLTEFIGDLKLLSEEERKEYEYLKEKYVDWKDDLTNKLSQWIFRRLASSNWKNIRKNRVMPYDSAKDENDDRHPCPLPLDIYDRLVILWSNPGDKVLDPCAGMGTGVYSATSNNRFGIGMEVKPSYFQQMVKNMENEKEFDDKQQMSLNM